MKRRSFLTGLAATPPALWLAGCADPAPPMIRIGALRQRLRETLAEPDFGAPGAMAIIRRNGTLSDIAAVGMARFEADGVTEARALETDRLVRCASISKLATALLAGSLSDEGILDLDADIATSAGLVLDGPGMAGRPVSVRQLLGHVSGLADPPVYWLNAPGRIETLLTEAAFSGAAPGERFLYCNLGYGVAATVMERITGERFDQLVDARVTRPLALGQSAFNWSGTPAVERREGVTLHVREDGRWQESFDTADFLNSDRPGVLLDEGFALADYEIGTNATIFGPQGGYRTTIDGMARLALAFAAGGPGEALAAPLMADAGPGEMWGSGPQILPAGLMGDHPELVGHPGEAYGFYGGAWAVRDGSIAFAYCVTGADRSGGVSRHPVSEFTRWEQELFTLVWQEIAAGGT